MVEEELGDIMVHPVGATMILEGFHVVMLKGVDLLLSHMREDIWTTMLHLLVTGRGKQTGACEYVYQCTSIC
jgi:hypothetical protein